MSDEFTYIEENVARLKDRIEKAAASCGRDPDEITLVGVTKTIDIARMKRLTECGVNTLGENRVQELLEKHDSFPDCEWHLIGNLQKNKVKYLPGKVSLIHSVDSIGLASELDRKAAATGIRFDVLVEINIAGEETKFGIRPEETDEFIESASHFKNISVKGLMTIAPYTGDMKKIGRLFENIYKIYIDMQNKRVDNTNIQCLSMGMTNDFEMAIREGSNMIRIGTAIFGQRK